MGESAKITSIVDLAKYKIGSTLYWVVLRPDGPQQLILEPGEEWLNRCHPKTAYERGFLPGAWRYRGHLPRLGAIDFPYFVELLTCRMVVAEFVVDTIQHSTDTGEFIYGNLDGETMPEDSLFTTAAKARAEIHRIKRMFRRWLDRP